MLPSSFLSLGGSSPREVPPPHNFRPLELPLREASYSIGTEFFRLQGNTTARDNGLRYEFQVHDHLRKVLGAAYVACELRIVDAKGQRRDLIPDGVFFNPDFTIVFEVKSQHMPEAWWQLRRLYQPVFEFKRPKHPTFVVEVVKSYDPGMVFPEAVELISDLREYVRAPKPSFGVYQWTP